MGSRSDKVSNRNAKSCLALAPWRGYGAWDKGAWVKGQKGMRTNAQNEHF